MKQLKERLKNEIEDFRKLGYDFLEGNISTVDFKKISGGRGVYAHKDQKHFMIRLRIPSGMLDFHTMKVVLRFAERYKLETIHLTTRQAIQLHGLTIDEICDVMAEALDEDIYTRGAGGNFPRNIAMSPLAGVEIGEAFDVSYYARAVGDYLLKAIDTYHLPRKLKISFSSTSDDDGQCTVQDMGFLATTHEGEPVFKLYLGGGLGRNPQLAEVYDEFVRPEEVCTYVEAMIQFYQAEGDYDNKNKARVRYILERMGKEVFIKTFKKHVNEVKKNTSLLIKSSNLIAIQEGEVEDLCHKNVINQKQHGLYSVYVHPVGGQLKVSDFRHLVEKMEHIPDASIRLTMKESFYVINLTAAEAKEILEITDSYTGKTKLSQSVACIGVPTCQIGILESQGLLTNILKYFEEKDFTQDCIPRLQISGCPNCCGMHLIGGIGFSGKRKKVNGELKNVYSFYIGGHVEDEKAILGTYLGDLLEEDIPKYLYEWAVQSEAVTSKDYIQWIRDNVSKELV